jgi:hypothetical protein
MSMEVLMGGLEGVLLGSEMYYEWEQYEHERMLGEEERKESGWE